MKILFLSTWHPYPPDNGSRLRAYYLLRALAARHNVVAMAFRPHQEEGHVSRSVLAAAHPIIDVIDDPFRYVDAPQLVKYLSLSPLAYRASTAMQDAVAALSHASVWDAVVVVQMPVAQYAMRVSAVGRIIDVDTAMTFQLYESYRRQNRRLVRARHWLSAQKARRYESRMLRNFQAATVVWPPEADLLQQITAGSSCRVVVVPNGVDCVHNQVSLAACQPCTLVYNGSMTYSANYDAMRWFLAEVYPLIKVQQPEVRLVITGSVQGVDLTSLALDSSVHLTGRVDDVRVPVAEATVCIAPIRQGGGTRLKILEAMALGTPVVSTTKGAEGLNLKNGEHFLCADRPGEFAQAALALLGDARRRSHLAANARRLVEADYDWNRIGNRFVDLVEESVRCIPAAPLAGKKST